MRCFYALITLAFSLISFDVSAQDIPPVASVNPEGSAQVTDVQAAPEVSSDQEKDTKKSDNYVVTVDKVPSLFFTYWQHDAIDKAKNAKGKTRAPSAYEMDEDNEKNIQPGDREIIINGIVFNSTNDWTVWLNGKRITPEALPKEVLDFRVRGDYVEFKWLDEYTNQIFPLRMRAHERFNLDMKMFLPG